MQPSLLKLVAPAIVGLGLTVSASAQAVINVSSDVTTSTTWTANNVYRLQTQIFVRPGATLTIEPGTLIASVAGLGGSLAVSRGGQIFAEGDAQNPIIFTSTADTATWAGGEFGPRETGTWREAANEWGNVTIMGNAFISENAIAGNTPTFNPNNRALMEGLTEAFPGDPDVRYGGGNDDDNSGTLAYCSFRYGGNVIGLNNELNGLSLGGIGRSTDIFKVEIMNNVDDGVEIWGGTVCPRYISIWNIGDDSFDIDQGWRGSAQWILIVQGYSLNASQGSGVGDNAFEHDGAEDSFFQPRTSATIYNATVIGQPDGDGMTAWRDNAHVQYRNCLFVEGGETLVRPDNVDGDGAQGYGVMGTLSFPACWFTPAGAGSPVFTPGYTGNAGIVGTTLAQAYQTQVDGNLCEIKDSVIHNVATTSNAAGLGVFAPTNNNIIDNVNLPLVSLTRAAAVVRGGRTMERVIGLDPRPAAAALNAVGFASGPKFDSIKVRGAFTQGNNWLSGWTASEQFGFTPRQDIFPIRGGSVGVNGVPVLAAGGGTTSGSSLNLSIANTGPSAFYSILINPALAPNNLLGLELLVDLPTSATLTLIAGPTGSGSTSVSLPPLPLNFDLYFQALVIDPTVAVGPFFLPAVTSTGVQVTING